MNEVKKQLEKTKGQLKCSRCESEEIKAQISYDGITSHGFVLDVYCNECGAVSTVARLTTERPEVVEVKEDVNISERTIFYENGKCNILEGVDQKCIYRRESAFCSSCTRRIIVESMQGKENG